MVFKIAVWAASLSTVTMLVFSQTPSSSQAAADKPSDSATNTQKIVATTVISGSNDNNHSTKPPASPQSAAASPSSLSKQPQAWDTSVLCKHLANITGQHHVPDSENVVEEPIEAKCFPGFVCVNGMCTGGMSCKCFDGWAGLFCQAPCPTDCAPGGTCATSTNNQAICVCNETSKYTPGVGCVEKPPEFFTTTTTAPLSTPGNLRPLSERECFGAFTCIYGFCQFSSLQCACDPGWKGQLCDQPCELNCSGHGRCHENDEFVLTCVCESFYTGEFCEIALQKSNSMLAQNSSLTNNKEADMILWGDQNSDTSGRLQKNTTMFEMDNSTGNSNNASVTSESITQTKGLKPLSERECQPGYVCKYGDCEKDTKSCSCDRGWGGALCDMTCDLSCRNDGRCIINDGGTQICKCQEGFSGKNCELNVTDDPWKELAEHVGQLPPLSQRFCQSGFVCAYGTCSKEPENVECICDPRFTDKFCQTPCPLSCETHRHCEFSSVNKTPICLCDLGYTGVNCTETADLDEVSASTVVAASVAGAILLLLLFLCLLFSLVLYRKRNITMMAIVYWFRRYEDQDGKDYDAFVFYGSADLDRQFVIQTLVPKLEGRMCFTLCIHQRNIVTGIPTTNNISELVRRSRRIILILSPSFVSNDWDKNEYLHALPEILTAKHKILPILLGDIDIVKNKLDRALGHVLKSRTLLKYPDKNPTEQDYNTFWKRLELAMPKKRSTPLEVCKSPSCLISPSILSQLEQSHDPKAPMEIRLFANGNLKTQLLQRIVRVPASKLDSCDKGSSVGCPAFDRMLGRSLSSNSDSQDGNLGAAAAEPYRRLLRHSTPSTLEEAADSIPNNGFNYSEAGLVQDDQRDSFQIENGRSVHNQEPWSAAANNDLHTGQTFPVTVLSSRRISGGLL